LPSLPTKISDANIPKGSALREGITAEVDGWGKGGAVQYEILQSVEKIPATWFKDKGVLK
jgi:hypothetical protein